MSPFLEDFDNRKKQVRHYLAIVLRVERISSLGRLLERKLADCLLCGVGPS